MATGGRHSEAASAPGGLPLGGSGGVEGARREPVTSRWGVRV